MDMLDGSPPNNRISLVIGSGGVKCAAAIGLRKVLAEEGIGLDLIVGCSGGSLYGVLFALGLSADEATEYIRSLWTRDIMQGYTKSLKAARDGSLSFDERSGMVEDSVMNERLSSFLGDRTFADLDTPMKLVATDMLSGEIVIISEGKLFDAIRATIAIPIIFPPWEVDGRLLIDGAASDPLPVDLAIQEGAEIIVAMGFMMDLRDHFRNLTAVQGHLNNIYMNNILRASFAFHNLAHHAEIIPILPEFKEPVTMYDTDKIPMIIELGEQETRKQLPYIRRLLTME
jgi:NTE family protein